MKYYKLLMRLYNFSLQPKFHEDCWDSSKIPLSINLCHTKRWYLQNVVSMFRTWRVSKYFWNLNIWWDSTYCRWKLLLWNSLLQGHFNVTWDVEKWFFGPFLKVWFDKIVSFHFVEAILQTIGYRLFWYRYCRNMDHRKEQKSTICSCATCWGVAFSRTRW